MVKQLSVGNSKNEESDSDYTDEVVKRKTPTEDMQNPVSREELGENNIATARGSSHDNTANTSSGPLLHTPHLPAPSAVENRWLHIHRRCRSPYWLITLGLLCVLILVSSFLLMSYDHERECNSKLESERIFHDLRSANRTSGHLTEIELKKAEILRLANETESFKEYHGKKIEDKDAEIKRLQLELQGLKGQVGILHHDVNSKQAYITKLEGEVRDLRNSRLEMAIEVGKLRSASSDAIKCHFWYSAGNFVCMAVIVKLLS